MKIEIEIDEVLLLNLVKEKLLKTQDEHDWMDRFDFKNSDNSINAAIDIICRSELVNNTEHFLCDIVEAQVICACETESDIN